MKRAASGGTLQDKWATLLSGSQQTKVGGAGRSPAERQTLSTDKTEVKNGGTKTAGNGKTPKRKISAKLSVLQDIVALMEEGDLSELHYEKGDIKIHMRRGGTPVVEMPTSAPRPVTSAAPVSASGAGSPDAVVAEGTGITVKSPMVGTFYRSSAPDSKPFVQEGAKVEVGQIYCIIEAMKLMNEIKSEVAGKVVKILVENGQVVEFGQPILIIDPQG